MRQLALIALAVLWFAPAQAETKKAPDGFGPVKFGMTKEEAWAALDGKGEWEEDSSHYAGFLTYNFEMPFGTSVKYRLRMRASISEGKVDFIIITLEDPHAASPSCNTNYLYIVGMIKQKYNVDFVTNSLRDDLIGFDIYSSVFVFPNRSLIDVQLLASDRDHHCGVDVFYVPAPPEAVPF